MERRMKNFNIFGVHKLRFQGGIHEKPIYWENCLKRGGRTFCRFKEVGRSKKEGVVSLRGGRGGGGLIPQCTLCDEVDNVFLVNLGWNFTFDTQHKENEITMRHTLICIYFIDRNKFSTKFCLVQFILNKKRIFPKSKLIKKSKG